MPKVVKIEPTINLRTHESINTVKKRRVCAYARVSTSSNEQEASYEAQVDYYRKYIMSHPDWEYVGIYTDEGITGTSTKHRSGFNDMINDAMNNKIDLILAKSVSRFARNTVDSLINIRKLKDKGVEVYFEKEYIWTFDSKGEILLTIMSSIAQEESRSISENVTWGIRKRFADGIFSFPYHNFLGYEKGENGKTVINKEEARIVRFIYRRYFEGATARKICRELEEQEISSPKSNKKVQRCGTQQISTAEWCIGAIENTIIKSLIKSPVEPSTLLRMKSMRNFWKRITGT